MNGSAGGLMPEESTVRTSDLFNYQAYANNSSASVDLMNPSSSNAGEDHRYSNGRSVIHKSSGAGSWDNTGSSNTLEQQSFAVTESNLLTENGYVMNTAPTQDGYSGNQLMPTTRTSSSSQQQQQQPSSSQVFSSLEPELNNEVNFTHVFNDPNFFNPFGGTSYQILASLILAPIV